MNKSIFLLVVALAIAGVPGTGLAQNMGMKVVATEWVDGSYVKTLSTDQRVVSVQHEHIDSRIDFYGNLKFITTDLKLGNKSVVDCKVTVGQLFDFVKVSNGYAVFAITRHSDDSFSKTADLAPQVTLLDDDGKVVFQKVYSQFGFHYVKGGPLTGLNLNGLTTETKDYFVVTFSGSIFYVNKKDGAVENAIPLRHSFVPVKLVSVKDNTLFLATRLDSSSIYSYQYDFFKVDLGNKGFNGDHFVWHYVMPIIAGGNASCRSEDFVVNVVSEDSFALIRYGNQMSRDSLFMISVSSKGIKSTGSANVPFLKNVKSSSFSVIKSQNGYYVISGVVHQDYQKAKLLATHDFKDTVFVLNETVDFSILEAKIIELSDASILITGGAQNPDLGYGLTKVARVPFKPALTAVWDGTLEWSNPFPDGGSMVDSFQIFYKTESDINWNTIELGTKLGYVLKNLKGSSKYIVKVRARNEAGWGTFSDTASFTTAASGVNYKATKTLTLYPNPAKSGETLTINAPAGAKILLFSYDGKMIFSGELSSDQIKLPDLSTGMYVVSVYTGNQQYQTKLSIE